MTYSVLQMQYRMHPSLAFLPNHLFYNGFIETASACTSNFRPAGFDWADRNHAAFIHVDGCESREGSSFGNQHQAEATAWLITRLLRPNDFKAEDIVVLTAYNGQRKILDETFKRILRNCEIKIMTVDSAQGQQYPIVILNTVRSNQQGSIGFLDSPERLNVSITRAKNATFIVGHMQTLVYGDVIQKMWHRVFTHYTCYEIQSNWYYWKLPVTEEYLAGIVKDCNWSDVCGPAKNAARQIVDANAKSSNDYSPNQIAKATETWRKCFQSGPQEDRLSDDFILQLIRTMQTWRYLTKQVLDNPCFSKIMSFLPSLPKRCRPGELYQVQVGETNSVKVLSYAGSVMFHGNAEDCDPTNVVYFTSLQIWLRCFISDTAESEGLRRRFLWSELPAAQMENLKYGKHCSGILNDAGDIIEAMTAICNLKTINGKQAREQIQRNHLEVTEPRLKSLYHLISVHVKYSKIILDTCWQLYEAKHDDSCWEFILHLVRELIRMPPMFFESVDYYRELVQILRARYS